MPWKPSRIKETEGYLGVCSSRSLEKGDTQHFTFDDRDNGPFNLNEPERLERKLDQVVQGTMSKKRMRADLARDLMIEQVEIPATKIRNMKWIVDKCLEKGIATDFAEQKKIEGWHGKEKGLVQICLERGLISKDQKIKVDELRDLLSECTDFKQEESQLQCIGRDLGVEVIFSPKCHPEVSGEGIEFIWALIKNSYRRIPLSMKKKKREDFLSEVHRLIMEVKVDSVRKCARRARQYICAYQEIHQGMNIDGSIPKEIIERLMRESYKSHREVRDSNFVNSLREE